MSKQNHIEVVVEGIRCKWAVMASYHEVGGPGLVCRRYVCGGGEDTKKVEKVVEIPKPSLTMAEEGAVDFLAETFGFNEDEANQMRDLAHDIKWKKSAYMMLRNLAEADKQ